MESLASIHTNYDKLLGNNKKTFCLSKTADIKMDELISSLQTLDFINYIFKVSDTKLILNIMTDKRGTELFVNQLPKNYITETEDEGNTITVEIPSKDINSIKNDFGIAFCKLRKYQQYKELIAKFVPGKQVRFPGYSFDDFELN